MSDTEKSFEEKLDDLLSEAKKLGTSFEEIQDAMQSQMMLLEDEMAENA